MTPPDILTEAREIVATIFEGGSKVSARCAPDVRRGDWDSTDEMLMAQAALRRGMALANGGWIPWAGGACPLDSNATVDLQWRDGDCEINERAGEWSWDHDGGDSDIVAYRPLKIAGEAHGPPTGPGTPAADQHPAAGASQFAPCPTCRQYSHSIGEDRLAAALKHFESMRAHPVRGHPMGRNFDEQTRDAAQVLIAAAKGASLPLGRDFSAPPSLTHDPDAMYPNPVSSLHPGDQGDVTMSQHKPPNQPDKGPKNPPDQQDSGPAQPPAPPPPPPPPPQPPEPIGP